MKNRTVSLVVFVIACISIGTYISLRQFAFPEHAIIFQINNKQAEQKAIQNASQLTTDINSYKKSTIFEIDETSKNYLERELGARQTGELAKNDVNLWYFTTRLFKPLQKEEFLTSYAPDGRLVSFSHQIEETQMRTSLEKKEAEKVGYSYLLKHCSLCSRTNFPDRWQFIQYTKTDRPNRIDHQFIYERKEYYLKDARQRVRVIIAGDTVIQFDEYLKVPQAWISSFNKEKSYNTIAQLTAELVSTLFLTLPLVLIFFKKYRDKKLSFKFPYYIALVMSAITLAAAANNFTQYYFSYPTTQNYYVVFVLALVGLLITWFFTFITSEMTIATAESYYRQIFPKKKNTFDTLKKTFYSPTTIQGIWIGACVGIIGFLYELTYYFLGKQLGFWVPADVNYSDAFNSIVPWIYPLIIGLLPAVNEEVMYRLFAVSLFKKFFGSKVNNQKVALIISVVLASMCWSFQHSAYPQMPFFVRGVELLVIGIVFSFLYLRFGILSSIAAHYSFNALQMAIFFLGSKSLSTSIPAFAMALLPFWVCIGAAVVQRVTKKRYSEEEIQNNEFTDAQVILYSTDKKTSQETPITRITSAPITLNIKLSLIAISIFALLLTVVIPFQSISKDSKSSMLINRMQAIKLAEEFLKRKNITVTNYISVATISTHSERDTTLTYLKSQGSPEKTKQFLTKNKEPDVLWNIRFFKPLQKEEYTVLLDSDGGEYTYQHLLDEKAAGVRLSESEALEKAQGYLVNFIDKDSNFSLVNNENLKRDNRDDYRFTFEDQKRIAEASRRISIDVIDGEPLNIQNTIKVPENYERKSEQLGIKQLVIIISSTTIGLLLLILGSNSFFKLYKEKKLWAKPGFNIAILASCFSIVSQVNHMSTFFTDYNTDLQIEVYSFFQFIKIPIYLILSFLAVTIIINGGIALYREYIGPLLPKDPLQQKKLLGDALFLVFFLSCIGVCILYLSMNLSERLYPIHTNQSGAMPLDPAIGTGIQTVFPALEGLKSISRATLSFFAVISVACIIRKYCRSWKNVLALASIISLLIFFFTGWKTEELLSWVILIGPMLLYTIITWKYIVKNNFFFYILTIFYILIGTTALSFLSESDTFLKLNGVGYLLIAIMPILIWLFYERILNKWGHALSTKPSFSQ